MHTAWRWLHVVFIKIIGGLAIAVPGMLHGLHSLWLRFGRLPWKDLFQPAIDLAREGFEVTKDIVRAINMRRELILSGNYPGLQWVAKVIIISITMLITTCTPKTGQLLTCKQVAAACNKLFHPFEWQTILVWANQPLHLMQPYMHTIINVFWSN